MGKTFEQKIADVVNTKLNDGTMEKVVEKYIEKGVNDALADLFGYNGAGRKIIGERLKDVIVPVIESHDFNKYLAKLDEVLTEIVNKTSLEDNKKILENFSKLMKEPENGKIKVSEIFGEYCKHVAKNIDTSELEAICEDEYPHYEFVSAQMEIEHEDKGYFKSDYDDGCIMLTCSEDESLNCKIKIFKRTNEDEWRILRDEKTVDINSLRHTSDFEIFLSVLNRSFTEIILDEEDDYNDEIEPVDTPEWSLS